MSNGGRVHLVAFGEPGLSNDKDVCMEAVSERGEALIHCSAQMRVLDQSLQFHCRFGNYIYRGKKSQKNPCESYDGKIVPCRTDQISLDGDLTDCREGFCCLFVH